MFTRFCGFSEHIHHGQRENHGFSLFSPAKVFFSVSPHFPIVSVAFQVPYLVAPDGRPRPRSRCSPPAGPRHGVARPWLVGNAKIASSWGDHMYIGSYWFILFDNV